MVRYRAGGLVLGGNLTVLGETTLVGDVAISEVTDTDGSTLLSGDGSGHIDDIARIDAPLLLNQHTRWSYIAGDVWIGGQANGAIADVGNYEKAVEFTANGTFNFTFIIPTTIGNDNLILKKAHIRYQTNANGDYIDYVYFSAEPIRNVGGGDCLYEDPDAGSGTTGIGHLEVTEGDLTTLGGRYLRLELTIVAPTKVTIFGFELEFENSP